MKSGVFDVQEMYKMGLNKGEILGMVEKAYEAEEAKSKQAQEAKREYLEAKRRVANDTYTIDDLDVLYSNYQLKNDKAVPKTISAKEFDDILTCLSTGLSF